MYNVYLFARTAPKKRRTNKKIVEQGYKTVKEYSDYKVAEKYLNDVLNW